MELIKVLPIILVILISGCTAQVNGTNRSENQSSSQPSQETSQQPTGQGTLQGEVISQHTVEITKPGFSPDILTIKLGDKVTFVNRDVVPHWPASAVHPTHCEYKGCGVFDAKKVLAQGEPYSIVFDLAGNWRYHDHLNPGVTGTIIVQ